MNIKAHLILFFHLLPVYICTCSFYLLLLISFAFKSLHLLHAFTFVSCLSLNLLLVFTFTPGIFISICLYICSYFNISFCSFYLLLVFTFAPAFSVCSLLIHLPPVFRLAPTFICSCSFHFPLVFTFAPGDFTFAPGVYIWPWCLNLLLL